MNPDTCRIRVDGQIRFQYGYVWTWKFLNPERKSCGSKNIRICGSYSNKQRILHAEKYFCTLKEKFCTSKRPCNVPFILKNTNEISSHFTLFPFFFLKERRDLSNVAITKVMFSRVRSKAYLVFVSEAYNILLIVYNRTHYHV